MLGDVAREPTLARPAEAAHAAGGVGGEAHARLLAVVADVDARLELAGDHVAHRRLRLARERGGIDALAAVRAHLWGGLVSGPFLLVLGVSGSALVFAPEIERLERPAALATTAAAPPSLEAVVTAALIGQPG